MRTTEELLKDADEVVEHVRTRECGYPELYSRYPYVLEKMVAELSAKLRESEKLVQMYRDVVTTHKKISPGCFDGDLDILPTPPKKED